MEKNLKNRSLFKKNVGLLKLAEPVHFINQNLIKLYPIVQMEVRRLQKPQIQIFYPALTSRLNISFT